MMRKKILSVIGTRPQLIKQAALQKAVPAQFDLHTIYTGQHYDPSLYDKIAEDLTLSQQTILKTGSYTGDYRLAYMTSELSRTIESTTPSAVLVFGDTDSTLAGALAANRKNIPLVHIEAGERSGNFEMPEEWNRCITDQLAGLLCCASEDALAHLANERSFKKIILTGDLMKDLLLHQSAQPAAAPLPHQYYLLTLHRNYTQQNKDTILQLLKTLNELDAPVIFPVHPSTEKHFQQHGIHPQHYPNIQFTVPLSYSDCIRYARFSKAVLTDSGGLQKEAYWLKKKCITLRKETEWKETLKGNWNTLWYEFSTTPPVHIIPEETAYDPSLYGDGAAGKKIFEALEAFITP